MSAIVPFPRLLEQAREAGGQSSVVSQATTGRAIRLLKLWWGRIRSRRDVQRLCEMDDHILRDIGLTRAQVLREARKPFWR